MTTGMQIVREETRRMLRGMAPLTLIAFGVFVAGGCDPVQAGASLLLGACYSLLLFRMIGKSAAKAALFPARTGHPHRPARLLFPLCADRCGGVRGDQGAVHPAAGGHSSAVLSQGDPALVCSSPKERRLDGEC